MMEQILETWQKVKGRLWPRSIENNSIRETLEELIEEEAEEPSELSGQEARILSSVLRMSEDTVEEVQVPRADIVAVSLDTSPYEVIELYKKTGFSRYPVYHENLDDVIGCVNVRDILLHTDRLPKLELKEIVREVLFIPESMLLIDLLLQMRATRIPMALIVDEYGGVDGLATAWNVMQELLGETDTAESSDAKDKVTKLSDGSSVVSARMELDEFESHFGKVLTEEEREEEENDTVGGLITSLIGRVPARKEVVKHPSGFEFEILEADPRRIIRVRIHKRKNSGKDINADPS